jgi:hypothetical protein
MGLRVRSASAVWIVAPVTVTAVIGALFLLSLLYLTPQRSSSKIRGMKAKKSPSKARAYFVEMGRQGGLKGGAIRAQKLTPERRREIARNAIAARWAKRKATAK